MICEEETVPVQKYLCTKHGVKDGIEISIQIKGTHRNYCLECLVEALDKCGVVDMKKQLNK